MSLLEKRISRLQRVIDRLESEGHQPTEQTLQLCNTAVQSLYDPVFTQSASLKESIDAALHQISSKDGYQKVEALLKKIQEIVTAARPATETTMVSTTDSQALRLDLNNLRAGYRLKNRFRVEQRLGSPGGFAVTYRVYDTIAQIDRVMKLTHDQSRQGQELWITEYRNLVDLSPHENVVKVVWADLLDDGTPYTIFEYVEGVDVNDYIQKKCMTLEKSLRILEDTAKGLAHLHKHGIYHQDIKPANLLMARNCVKIIDFNIAVSHKTAGPVGYTREYLPPDYTPAKTHTPAVMVDRDIYALGVTFYECVTQGRHPYAQKSGQPTDPREYAPHLSEELASFIRRVVAPVRKQRFRTTEQLLNELRRVRFYRSDHHTAHSSFIKTLIALSGGSATRAVRATVGFDPQAHWSNYLALSVRTRAVLDRFGYQSIGRLLSDYQQNDAYTLRNLPGLDDEGFQELSAGLKSLQSSS